MPRAALRDLALLLGATLPLAAVGWVTVHWEALTLPIVALFFWVRKWVAGVDVRVRWTGD